MNASHRCDLIGLSAVFQQEGNDVSVTLLSCLVQRRVAHLEGKTQKLALHL